MDSVRCRKKPTLLLVEFLVILRISVTKMIQLTLHFEISLKYYISLLYDQSTVKLLLQWNLSKTDTP